MAPERLGRFHPLSHQVGGGRTTHRPPSVDQSAASTGQRSSAEFGNERLTVFPLGPTTTVAAPIVNQKPGRSGRKIVDRPASVTVVEPSAFAVMNAGPEMFTEIPLPVASFVMSA